MAATNRSSNSEEMTSKEIRAEVARRIARADAALVIVFDEVNEDTGTVDGGTARFILDSVSEKAKPHIAMHLAEGAADAAGPVASGPDLGELLEALGQAAEQAERGEGATTAATGDGSPSMFL